MTTLIESDGISWVTIFSPTARPSDLTCQGDQTASSRGRQMNRRGTGEIWWNGDRLWWLNGHWMVIFITCYQNGYWMVIYKHDLIEKHVKLAMLPSGNLT